MSPSHADVIMVYTGNMSRAGTTDMGAADVTDAGSTEATDVGAADASDVGSAEATHVAAAKAAAMSAAAATATGLSIRRNKATSKQRSCKNHRPSCFHDLSPLKWADVPPQDLRQTPASVDEANSGVAMYSKMGIRVRSPY
jgi:hypothetical protein